MGTITETPFPNCLSTNCDRWQTSAFDITAYALDEPGGKETVAFGQMLGQLWLAFDDFGQDVTGKLRFTALQKANIDSDTSKFLHVTWSVDIVGSDRRYPQLIVTDQDAPIQDALDTSTTQNTIIIQTIDGPNMLMQAQIFHGLFGAGVPGAPLGWDVNNQDPHVHNLIDYYDPAPAANTLSPTESPFEHAGMDRMTQFDAYIGADRLYLFLDGTPAGCTLYPTTADLEGPLGFDGPVTVTFGDVLYHEGAPDELVCDQKKPYAFLHDNQCTETKRHFDDLGFKSGVPVPTWDETKLPCVPY
jgi:hypothetical protein